MMLEDATESPLETATESPRRFLRCRFLVCGMFAVNMYNDNDNSTNNDDNDDNNNNDNNSKCALQRICYMLICIRNRNNDKC